MTTHQIRPGRKAPAGAPAARAPHARLHRHLRRFARDERGVMIPMVIFFLLTLLVVCGVSVDVMRQEMIRARVQTTLDRAILAAADLDQQYDPATVVRDYFDKAGVGDYLSSVSVDQGRTFRIVTATANADMKTQFLGTIGFPTFKIYASGTAEESLGNAEISLVLDISGSMGANNRMTRLRTAAKEFIDTVILDETEGAVSVNLIPYTSQVNAGAAIMDRMAVKRRHAFSNCVRFEAADYNTTAIDPTKPYQQGEHFEITNTGGSATVTNPSCPMRSYEAITAFSQDRAALKLQIDRLTHRANTAIHTGMKWGVGLLDPAMRPVITGMVNAGLVPGAFAGRPSAYGSGPLKTVVLMTDGENFTTYGIPEAAYSTPSQRYHWHRYALFDWITAHVDEHLQSNFYEVRSTPEQADTLLANLCTRAKDQGILVWGVGFEVSNHGASVLRNCASSPSHFFRVEGTQISEAFASIARQLNKLKLTN